MDVLRFTDPRAFQARATAFLLADEPRHNVLLGVAAMLVERAETYPEFHLWTVEDGGRVVLVGMLTPPFNITISRPSAVGAIEALAAAIHGERGRPPGASGALPEVSDLVDAWVALTGEVATRRRNLRLYRITRVRPVIGVPGSMRHATVADRDLLLAWMIAFAVEALEQPDRERTERMLDLRFRLPDPGLYLWEDPAGVPVSLVAAGGRTANGIRLGPVYTPTPARRRGFAGALTAAVSALLLDGDLRFCTLYADLANPTANHIYRDIGYEPVCDAAEYRFDVR
jgi:predicted GNAT family acetyltransferase